TGANFVNGAVVRWNGNDRPTTVVSSTQLTATISAADVATAGTASVTVVNPAPGGGASGTVTFTIQESIVGSPTQYQVMLPLIIR
ncbi:MAG: IPT/TIG domain-containing protein, partial [Roseiflexus sp.]